LKLQKNSAERRKTNPTRTNSLKVVVREIRIAVRRAHKRLDTITNNIAKMRSDGIKRDTARTTPVKLEKSANNNTESIRSPNETRRAAKFASIDSTKRTSHNLSEIRLKLPITIMLEKHFNFIVIEDRK
jgi:hypothetical protein